jgi:polysaccharide biosynthesis/export protein
MKLTFRTLITLLGVAVLASAQANSGTRAGSTSESTAASAQSTPQSTTPQVKVGPEKVRSVDSDSSSRQPNTSTTTTPPPAVEPTPNPNAPLPSSAPKTKTEESSQPNTAEPTTQSKTGQTSSASTPASSTQEGRPYVIGALDVLFIKVWNNSNLTGMVDVRPDGMISMHLIGEFKADGFTVKQLKDDITRRLSDVLKNPEVDVQVVKINSKRYFIFGEVGRQGEFPLVGKTTLLDALSNAGGFRDFANPKKIYVLRGTQRFYFNYKKVSQGKHMEQNIELQNGDRIFVP